MKKQIALTGRPSLSLSLNVPGFPKSNPVATLFFAYCLRDLKYALKANLVTICEQEAIESCDAAGDFYTQEAKDYLTEAYKDESEYRKYVFGEITHVWIKK